MSAQAAKTGTMFSRPRESSDRKFPLSHPARCALAVERSMELCESMIDIAAALFNVSSKELRTPGRCQKDVSRVRQIAMYVCHVTVGLSMSEIGLGFCRDRTTVLYACHLVEDLRDDEDFDRLVTMTERVALTVFRDRIAARHG